MAKAEDHLAIREELHEHLESLAELDALIESSQDETGELQQVRDQLYASVQDLQAQLTRISAASSDLEPHGVEEDAGHAGLGFRFKNNGSSSSSDEEGDEGEDREEEPTPSEDAPTRAALAMMADAEAVAKAVQAGPQTDTVHFATWEEHTRGVGSKLMAAMGYRKGAGLGARIKGSAAPIEVQMLRKGAGLGMVALTGEGRPKKKSRGGERSRRKKLADAAKAAREAEKDAQMQLEIEAGQPGIFAFINSRLTGESEQNSGQAAASTSGTGTTAAPARRGKHDQKEMDRKALAAQQDEVAKVHDKLKRLQQMAVRNSKDKHISAQVKQKIAAVEQELAAAEARSAHAHNAVNAKEKEKKWMKF